MKALRIFCALLVLTGCAALVYATAFTWTGASSSAWDNANNWSPSTGFPDDSTDSARIDVNTNTPVSFSTGTYTVSTIAINADTNSATTGLTVSGGSLTTTGRTSVIGDQSGTSHTATLTVSGGTFAPDTLTFQGRVSATDGHAIGDFDADVTVGATTNSTVIYGNLDIDIASTKTLTAKLTFVGMGTNAAELKIGTSNGTGEFDCTGLAIEVGDGAGENGVVRLLKGTLDVNGNLALKGSNSLDAEAQLYVSELATLSPDALVCEGGGTTARRVFLSFDEDVTVGGDMTVTGITDLDIGLSETLTVNNLEVGDGTNTGNLEILESSSNSAFLSATQVIIKGGTSDTSYLTIDHSTVVTRDG
jgi:hypothetical protein